MGRLRGGEESELFLGVAEEVVDLFGADAILYKLASKENCDDYDPVYGEVPNGRTFKSYRIKINFQDYTDEYRVSERGESDVWTLTVFVALRHLKQALIQPDAEREYIAEGDLLLVWYRGQQMIFDVIEAGREGYVNNSDTFVGYNLQVKRNSQYVPERNVLPEVING